MGSNCHRKVIKKKEISEKKGGNKKTPRVNEEQEVGKWEKEYGGGAKPGMLGGEWKMDENGKWCQTWHCILCCTYKEWLHTYSEFEMSDQETVAAAPSPKPQPPETGNNRLSSIYSRFLGLGRTVATNSRIGRESRIVTNSRNARESSIVTNSRRLALDRDSRF